MGNRRRRYSAWLGPIYIVLAAALATLAYSQSSFGASTTLVWTAPGDDGSTGRASSYDLRYSPNPIVGTDTLSWWSAATAINMTGRVPSVAGARDSMLVTGLVSGTRYYAVLRTADEVPNWSGFSDVAVIDAYDTSVSVQGVVRDAVSGAAIPGALIQASPGSALLFSAADGSYSVPAPLGVTVWITVTKYGYEPASTSVVLGSSGQSLDIRLSPKPSGTLLGTVLRAADRSALTGAEVSVYATPLLAVTGLSGSYQLSIPTNTVTVRCERPGFQPALSSVTINANTTTQLNFSLRSVAFWDDAETDKGWSLSAAGDNATTGVWVRALPVGTTTGTAAVQPSADHSPSGEGRCFVTGNGTTATNPGEADVDGGRTTLTSPVLRLTGYVDARIVYWRWYSNNAGSNPGEDAFVTQISNNGMSWVTVDSLYATHNSWDRVEIRVADFFPTPGNVQVRFIAMDANLGSIVEAGIDDLEYYSAALATDVEETGSTEAPAMVVGLPRPSPSSGRTEIDFELGKGAPVDAQVFDVQGRRVCVVEHREMPAGHHVLRWDGRTDHGEAASSGVYWLRITAARLEKRVKIIVVR